ncbi:uncharacterized protein LOC134340238 isoform X1 [Mobula hypostoma]|uniref:uncharacterized protein LOC134340238 isoform X1 n=1 Tax=Mobula hypostoma TaxID=723540 RepID=UPI002FC3AD8B
MSTETQEITMSTETQEITMSTGTLEILESTHTHKRSPWAQSRRAWRPHTHTHTVDHHVHMHSTDLRVHTRTGDQRVRTQTTEQRILQTLLVSWSTHRGVHDLQVAYTQDIAASAEIEHGSLPYPHAHRDAPCPHTHTHTADHKVHTQMSVINRIPLSTNTEEIATFKEIAASQAHGGSLCPQTQRHGRRSSLRAHKWMPRSRTHMRSLRLPTQRRTSHAHSHGSSLRPDTQPIAPTTHPEEVILSTHRHTVGCPVLICTHAQTLEITTCTYTGITTCTRSQEIAANHTYSSTCSHTENRWTSPYTGDRRVHAQTNRKLPWIARTHTHAEEIVVSKRKEIAVFPHMYMPRIDRRISTQTADRHLHTHGDAVSQTHGRSLCPNMQRHMRFSYPHTYRRTPKRNAHRSYYRHAQRRSSYPHGHRRSSFP